MQSTGARHFSTRFLLPVTAAAAITVVAVTGFLIWSAQRIDSDAVAREMRLMERALAEEKHQLVVAQEELGAWDEAVDAYNDGDVAWLADNLGVSAYQYYTHNRVYLTDRQLKPLFAVQDGGQVPAKAVAGSLAALQPLFEEIASVRMQAAASAYNAGVSDRIPSAMAFTLFEGEPALAGIMPLLSYSGENALPVGTEPFYVSVILLDDVLAAYFGDQYLVDAPAFSATRPDQDPALPIIADDGTTIAWLTWQADRPGARLLFQTLPALLGGLAIAAIIVGLLLRTLRNALAQLEAEREEARHRALHDPLTGLGNRSLFHARLADSIRTMPRGAPSLALLALDLDRFKQVNDTLGHQAGDDLLRQVGNRISALLRPEDTLVRLGGDEFAVIQPGITSHAQAESLARAIIDALTLPVHLGAAQAQIGTSIGIATAPDLAMDAEELSRFADDALYRAKNGGRNRYCLYSPEPANGAAQLDERLRDSFATPQAARSA
ncbi:MAG: hypothetical protein ABS76_24150 [Pelagibacterium sp. SCN 64-44]|nr:MAG: hypothetical protein ABS76_24150 [Pelagibacterium sp. SCN 64-44]